MAAIAVMSKTMRRMLSHRNYAVLTISTAVSLVIVQIFILLILFWARVDFRGFPAGHGIYLPRGSLLPILLPENTLLWFGYDMILTISPIQFFFILLISTLMSIYVSMMIFFRVRCGTSCRREASIGIASFGVGVSASAITSPITVMNCCGGGPSHILPLIDSSTTSFLGIGLSILGPSFSKLFQIAIIIILIAFICWLGSKQVQ